MTIVKVRAVLWTLLGWAILVVHPQGGPHAPLPFDANEHFRWSERLAHELSYQHTIANAKELTSAERKDLLAFVLNRFENPFNSFDAEMFEGISKDRMRKLAANTRIELIDLNGDGKDEIIAQGNGLGPCGGTGNCIVLVLQRGPEGIRILLDSESDKTASGFEKIRILDTSTNGFRDIVLATHDSASDRTLEVFQFADGKYRMSRCYYATTQPRGIPEGLRNPVITLGCRGIH
ncbi:MAG TPA: hypothetical protein VMU71_08845 [Terracidiphilus sp.]|nr:hypothetical protein [Terracidiphilus sp.]